MPQETAAYRPTPASPTHAEPQTDGSPAVEEADAILDEIDSVLEENALEVVRAYVNKGGQ